MTDLVCALTGHRDLPESFDSEQLMYALDDLIGEGYKTFCCGMARGFDLTALSCLIRLKERYTLRLIACIPHRGQESRYPEDIKKLYRELIERCDEKIVLSENFYQGCFLVRDRYMVDRADLVYAYCTKETGGTAYTVNYAREKGVEVRNFIG